AAPPVIVAALGSILWTVSTREVFRTPDNLTFALYIFLIIFSLVVIVGVHIFNLIVMGGATRNLVAHLLKNEPVSVRATYSAVRTRFWGLLGASLLIVLWTGVSVIVAFVGWYFIFMCFAIVTMGLVQIGPTWLITVVVVLGTIVATAVALWLFFLMIARVAYVPQVMLVEGRAVFESIGRSFTLARGNVRRLMGMTLFVTFATYAALWILVVPLGWYGYFNGIDVSPWSSASWPMWYAIVYSILG